MVSDISKVTETQPNILYKDKYVGPCIIIGTIGKSKIIEQLVDNNKIKIDDIEGQWESFLIQTVDDCLVIAGSDKRGTIYGIYDLSEKIGVSPWYYWADVPIEKK